MSENFLLMFTSSLVCHTYDEDNQHLSSFLLLLMQYRTRRMLSLTNFNFSASSEIADGEKEEVRKTVRSAGAREDREFIRLLEERDVKLVRSDLVF